MEGVSQLPEHIIHHILSYLETKEAARSSIFCKTWYNAWLTCPTLDFGKSSDFPAYNIERIERFLKFIKNTLQRYQDRKLCIVQLILGLAICNDDTASLLDEWIGIAVQHGVKRLELDFDVYLGPKETPFPYTLPSTTFEAKALRELTVCGTNVKLWSSLDKVMFNHLQKLHLSKIYIDDDTFQGIIKRCPLINNLCVDNCEGLKRIKVTKLYNLKEFIVCAYWGQPIEIDAPHLQYLDCSLYHGSATFLDNFGHKFPQVEDLRLANCRDVKRIDISSQSLKRMMLKGMLHLREVNIDAPRMLSLNLLEVVFFPDVSLTNVSSQLVSKISIYSMETCQFCQMKGFLAKLIPSKISLALWFDPECKFDDVRKIPLSPAVEVEDLHLGFVYSAKLTCTNFVDALFLTCHPKAITVGPCEDVKSDLYWHLIGRRNRHYLLTCHEIKSWYQLLKEVRFEIYDITKNEWQPSEWMNLLGRRERNRARFRLTWETYYPHSFLL